VQPHDIVGVIALALSMALVGFAFGMWQGAQEKIRVLENLLSHGTAKDAAAGRTIMPETAEMRIDKSAAQVEQEYTKATIENGISHLEALYISEGAQVPSRKDLEAEVKEMLGRSGTAEAGINA